MTSRLARVLFALSGAAAAAAPAGCLRPKGGSENAPVAVLEVAPTELVAGGRIIADATGSSDADGPPAGFCFAFDEGGAPVVRNLSGLATYTYATPGDHVVRVVVFDDACPLPLLAFDSECQVTNEDLLRRMHTTCTRATDYVTVTVADVPEAGPDAGSEDGGDSGPALCFPDALEPNDTIDTATPSGGGTVSDLTVCDMDVDFFAYGLSLGDIFQATLMTDPSGGDIDAILIDPEGMFVAVASTAEDEYTLQFEVLTPGVHQLEIFGFGGQRGGYSLTVSIF